MRNLAGFVLVIGICYTAGCGTYASLEHRQSNDPIILGGVRTDLALIKYHTKKNKWLQEQKLFNPYFDMPFSAVSDVVLLPYTIPYALLKSAK